MMLDAIARAQAEGFAGAPASEMAAALSKLAALRGRPAFFDYLGAGLGRGARAMLADRRWLLDFTLGIGVHLFGHGNLDLIETAIRAAASDLVMQGNLIFNSEYVALMETLLAHAPAGIDSLLAVFVGRRRQRERAQAAAPASRREAGDHRFFRMLPWPHQRDGGNH